MESLLGTSIAVFIGVTIILFGGAALMMGRAVGATWRPAWHCVGYGLMLGVADRFLIFALFGGDGLSLTGLAIDTGLIIAIALLARRVTQVNRMIGQYPWMYERTGLLGWREKA
ncbi:MAG: hypothetical protein EXQ94_03970 [Alphaproteobacteria bacterium]|nr:hypothetical protein [Alphaproteobacteria bacterium]